MSALYDRAITVSTNLRAVSIFIYGRFAANRLEWTHSTNHPPVQSEPSSGAQELGTVPEHSALPSP